VVREGKEKNCSCSVVREGMEFFSRLVSSVPLDISIVPKIPRDITVLPFVSYKTGGTRREQNLSLGIIHMFVGIYSLHRNT
jgi:hypothetical protein